MRASSALGVCVPGLTVGPSLERIGAGAFGYDFGALDDTGDPFTKSYTNLLYDRPPCPQPKVHVTLSVFSVR